MADLISCTVCAAFWLLLVFGVRRERSRIRGRR